MPDTKTLADGERSDVPSAWRLETAMAAWASARARILSEDADLAGDETALAALLGNEEGDIESILGRLLRASRHANAQVEALKTMIDNMQDRRERYVDRANAMRGTALAILQAMNWPKKEWPDMTVSIRPGSTTVEINDADAIPDLYVENIRKIDRQTIASVLKSGGTVPGAELVTGLPSITVRVK